MPDINTIYTDMPETIKSFVVCNPDFSYTIVLNSRLSHEQNLISYAHEISHIKNNDFDKNCSDINTIELVAHCN